MRYLLEENKELFHLISLPFISSVIIPLTIADLWIELYHHICFPLYGLQLVDRKKYIKLDRHKLKHLTAPQKMYCVYCGYANGLFPYWVKIASETEKYWCGIKHKQDREFFSPTHHDEFIPYELLSEEQQYTQQHAEKLTRKI